MLERRVALFAERVELTEELQLAAQVLDDDEGELAVHAARDDAAGDATHVRRVLPRLEGLVGGLQRPDLVARLVPGGIRGAGLAPRGELVTPLGEDVAVLSVLLVHGGDPSGLLDGQDLELLGALGDGDGDLVAGLVADDGLADRRLVGQLVRSRVGLGRTDDGVLDHVAALHVLQRHLGADADDVGARSCRSR